MNRRTCLLAAALFVAGSAAARAEDNEGPDRKSLPDGVYAVLRDGEREKDLLPLKAGEVLAVDRHRYQKDEGKEPPRFLVVRPAPDVPFDLDGGPRADREGGEVVRIRLKLRPKAAAALERTTRDNRGRQLAILIGGEVVTVHKVRAVIANGDVQITSCAPGGAAYLLERLQARQDGK